jgi:hypothetical protein
MNKKSQEINECLEEWNNMPPLDCYGLNSDSKMGKINYIEYTKYKYIQSDKHSCVKKIVRIPFKKEDLED